MLGRFWILAYQYHVKAGTDRTPHCLTVPSSFQGQYSILFPHLINFDCCTCFVMVHHSMILAKECLKWHCLIWAVGWDITIMLYTVVLQIIDKYKTSETETVVIMTTTIFLTKASHWLVTFDVRHSAFKVELLDSDWGPRYQQYFGCLHYKWIEHIKIKHRNDIIW